MLRATILVVDDNRDILNMVRLLLENEDFKVVTAEDCVTALNYLTQYSPDLILTDLMIPEMTGLEFIHRIRRICNYDRVPIIAMSAYDQTYLAAAIKAGAVTALHKPEDIDILVKTVKAVLAKNYRGEAAQAD
jgi:Response regulator containing CheY-like receiver, AAA-type ATPase, and DNA-binding domains